MTDDTEDTHRDPLGRFTKGARFWEARTSVGRPRLFANPDDLWLACVEYFKWAEDNPLWEAKAFAFQGAVTVQEMPKMRAMTIGGLCLFLDIDKTTWFAWAKEANYSNVIARVEDAIRHQKFAGAAADLLNANIIARDLGLSDKQDHTSSDGSMTPKATIDATALSTATLTELLNARRTPAD